MAERGSGSISGLGSGANTTLPCPYGKYELLERIGEGGMAEVFRARLPGRAGFEKIVVIKRILPHLATRKHVVEMFLDEARLTAQVQHKNIVQVFELGEHEESGEIFMVLEYIAGKDLRGLLRHAQRQGMRIPPWFTLHVMAEVLDGLAYAHELTDEHGQPRNVIHRDVSPSNIFVSFLGEVKLGDFGIAKEREQTSLTRTGQLKGKIAYMSPEQLFGEKIDQRADVFAAGVVLWELLTQHRLFGGRPDIGALKMICEGPRPAASTHMPDIPPALDDCVLAALAIDRGRRTSSARDLQSRLLELLHQLRPIIKPPEVRRVIQVLLGRQKAEGQEFALDRTLLGEDWDDDDDASSLRGSPPPAGTPGAASTEMELAFEHSRLHTPRPTMPVLADTPAFAAETGGAGTSSGPGERRGAAPAVAHPDEGGDWLLGAEAMHAENSKKLLDMAKARWSGFGLRPMEGGSATGVDSYEGPDGFWFKDEDGHQLGPVSYGQLIEFFRGKLKDQVGEAWAVSGDGQRWVPLPRFVELAGLEGLMFDERTRPPEAPIAGYLDERGMIAIAGLLSRDQATGRLLLAPEGLRRTTWREIHLVRGSPTYVLANEEAAQLPDFLLARRFVTRDAIGSAVHAVFETGRPLIELVPTYAAPGAPMIGASKLHVLWMKERLVDVFRWTAGRFTFEPEFKPPPAAPFARSLSSLVPELVHRAFPIEALREVMATAIDVRLEAAPRPELNIDELAFSPTQKEIVQRITRGKKLNALIKAHPSEERLYLLVAFILLESGILVRA